jgi:hypothetical protein
MKYPDPCPDTGRRVATVAEWADRPDELIDEYAYWHDPELAEMGLDPWRLIEGVDRRLVGGAYDVDFVNGGYRTVPGDQKIYIRAKHFDALNAPRP